MTKINKTIVICFCLTFLTVANGFLSPSPSYADPCSIKDPDSCNLQIETNQPIPQGGDFTAKVANLCETTCYRFCLYEASGVYLIQQSEIFYGSYGSNNNKQYSWTSTAPNSGALAFLDVYRRDCRENIKCPQPRFSTTERPICSAEIKLTTEPATPQIDAPSTAKNGDFLNITIRNIDFTGKEVFIVWDSEGKISWWADLPNNLTRVKMPDSGNFATLRVHKAPCRSFFKGGNQCPEDIIVEKTINLESTTDKGVPIDIRGNCNEGEVNTALGCIPIGSANNFIAWILKFAIGIGGGIAFLLMLFGVFQIITSSGDPERLKAGKELITSALIGLLMIIFSVFLLQLIGVQILDIPGFAK